MVWTRRISGVYWKEISIHQGLLSRTRAWMWRILHQWQQRYIFSRPLFPWLLRWLVLLGKNRGCSKACIRNSWVWGRSNCKSHRWCFGGLSGRAWRWRRILFISWVHSRRRLIKKVEVNIKNGIIFHFFFFVPPNNYDFSAFFILEGSNFKINS